MADQEKSNQSKAGEKKPGKFHYNPGNMSGKTVEVSTEEPANPANEDRIRSRETQQPKKE